MNQKNAFAFLFLIICALSIPATGLFAQSTSAIHAKELVSAKNPDSPTNIANALLLDHTITRMIDSSARRPISAGVSMDKNITSTVMAPDQSKASEWFKSPTPYLTYQYTNQSDKRPNFAGYDGDINSVQVGLDFLTLGDVLVGAVYTGTDADLRYETGGVGPLRSTDTYESESHSINLYASKTFADWLLLGATAGYTKSHSSQIDEVFAAAPGGPIPSVISTLNGDGFSIAPFIGAYRTWGAWTVATVPTYLLQTATYQEERVNSTNPADQSGGTLIWKNKVDYAVNEKVILGLKMDFNQVLHVNGVGATASNLRIDDNWVTFGPKATFYPFEKWEVNLAYENDLFNQTYDNHRLTFGTSYAF
jgi:hypothetical protein